MQYHLDAFFIIYSIIFEKLVGLNVSGTIIAKCYLFCFIELPLIQNMLSIRNQLSLHMGYNTNHE